jgi:hypothetical protein
MKNNQNKTTTQKPNPKRKIVGRHNNSKTKRRRK